MLQHPEYFEPFMQKDAEGIEKLKKALEKEIRPIENDYRRRNDLEEVPEYLPKPSKP